MPPPFGFHTLGRRYSSWKKYNAGQRDGPSTITTTGQAQLPLLITLDGEQLRRTDASLVLFFKTVHGLVAVPLPDYIHHPNRISRHCHSLAFRQLTTTNTHSFYWRLSSGTHSLQMLHAYQTLIPSRSQSVSCNIPGRRPRSICF